MDKRSTKIIEEAAQAITDLLPSQASLLSGARLTAWRILQVLEGATEEKPMLASAIAAALIEKYGESPSDENVRAIARALQAGGVKIGSRRRRGYWIDR